VSDFLAAALNLDSARIQLMWSAFGDLAEASHNETPQPSLDDAFRVHSRLYSAGLSFILELKLN
jgi:hypothetical protein